MAIRKSIKATKKNWVKLYAKAHEASRGVEYPAMSVEDAMTFAQDNANDTFKHNEDAPGYWDVAFNSIQCSLDAYCREDLYAWFTKNGWVI